MLKLYSSPLSANGRKVLALCNHLEVAAEIHEVNVYKGDGQQPDYLALNPTGKIPCIQDESGMLTESNAILQYLSDAYSDGTMSGSDPAERAQIASWLFWEAAHWQPVLSDLLAPTVGHLLLPSVVPAPAAGPDWTSPPVQALLERLESSIRGDGDGDGDGAGYVSQGKLTIADFSIAGMTTYFRRSSFPPGEYPAIADWLARIEELEAWHATATELWS